MIQFRAPGGADTWPWTSRTRVPVNIARPPFESPRQRGDAANFLRVITPLGAVKFARDGLRRSAAFIPGPTYNPSTATSQRRNGMAKIVLGLGSSHAPQLRLPPNEWYKRVNADHANPELWYEGRTYTFPELVEERGA